MPKKDRVRNCILPRVVLGLGCLLAVWLVLAPSEARLGSVIKLVYLHGALVWVGLATFALAGLLGLVALLVRRPIWYSGSQAAGIIALLLWIVTVLSSMGVTGLTWGQLIAWNEPRVRATGLILAAALLLALVCRLVGNRDFAAGVNVLMGIVPWVVVQQADVIRHPANPIGGSESSAIQFFYLLITATVACLAVTLTAWTWLHGQWSDGSNRHREE